MQKVNRSAVLVSGAILQLFLGIIYVWSVFVLPVSEEYGWPVADAKLVSSFLLGFFVLGMLGGGRMEKRLGTHRQTLAGGTLLAIGMAATAFIPAGSGWLICLTYGMAGGFGVGMGYGAVVSCVPKWYPQKRGLATGVSVCAFGFSTVVFAPLIGELIRRYSLRPAFLILAAAFLLVTLAFSPFIRLPEAAGGGRKADGQGKRQYTTGEMIKTGRFFLITCSLMLGTSAFFILNPSFVTLANERNIGSMATLIVMITGIASAAGRLIFPLISEKTGREATAVMAIGLTALCSFALCFAQGLSFIVIVAICALCYGGYSGIYPLLTGDYFGLEYVGPNFAAVMCGFSVSALCFPMILTRLFAGTSLFVALGVLCLVGVGLLAALIMSKKATRETAADIASET
ncbi:MAG: MFS transporter [Synergistaceae bacterium]|nr:MFS transporter [Synergistaceae bacterium]